MPTNRRSFMKATGIAAVMGATGLAGCNGLLGGGGSEAAAWQYDPASLSQTRNRAFGSMQYGEIYSMRDQLPASTRESFQVAEDSPIDPANIDLFTGVAGGTISMQTGGGAFFGSAAVTGSFQQSTLEDAITQSGEAEQVGTYEGYSLWESPTLQDGGFGGTVPGEQQIDGTATFAVSNEAMVFGIAVAQGSSTSVTGRQTVETMIDAHNGNATSLRDASANARTVQDKLGPMMLRVGGEVDPALIQAYQQQAGAGGMEGQFINGLRAGGFGADVTPDVTTYRAAIVYDSGQNAEQSGIVDLVGLYQRQAQQSEAINSISANRDGSTIVVTIEGDTQTLLQQGQNQVPGGGGAAVPISGD